jgi:hypothetical protein
MKWLTVAPWRPIAGTGQNLTFGASSVASTAFDAGNENAQAIQVSATTANCHIQIGTAPVAVVTDLLVKASDPPLILRIAPGEKLAVIQDTATGTLNIVELTH